MAQVKPAEKGSVGGGGGGGGAAEVCALGRSWPGLCGRGTVTPLARSVCARLCLQTPALTNCSFSLSLAPPPRTAPGE